MDDLVGLIGIGIILMGAGYVGRDACRAAVDNTVNLRDSLKEYKENLEIGAAVTLGALVNSFIYAANKYDFERVLDHFNGF